MLDEYQLKAAHFYEGPCLVLAGPGAGKTTVLVERLRFLLTQKQVLPESILVLTFTKAAAVEMKERFLKEINKTRTTITFGTFHSVFYSILKNHYRLKKDCILNEGYRDYLLKRCADLCGISYGSDNTELISAVREISYVKNTGIDPKDYEPKDFDKSDFINLIARYDSEKKVMEKMDFDDMLIMTKELFLKNEKVKKRWQDRYRFILIDEAQDMNNLQFDIIRMIAMPQNNVFEVGDDDQSIYAFRGANPSLMLEFGNFFPGAEIIRLKNNYRSCDLIVGNAANLISHNKLRYDKIFYAKSNVSGRISVINAADEADEARKISEMIYNLRKNDKMRSIAVLYRVNQQSMFIKQELRRRGIDYYSRDGDVNIYENVLFRDLEAYFSLGNNMLSRNYLLRILNRPNRYIPRSYLDDTLIDSEWWMQAYRGDRDMSDRIGRLLKELARIERLSAAAAIRYILKGLRYEDFLKAEAKSTGQPWDVFVLAINEAMEIAKKFPNKKTYIRELHDRRSDAKKEKSELKKTDVRLMTYHGSKGLEFDSVFLLNVNDGITPSYHSVENSREPAMLEEERRMFYVAVTRAKEELIVSTVAKKAGIQLYPSRFLEEMASCCNFSEKSMNCKKKVI